MEQTIINTDMAFNSAFDLCKHQISEVLDNFTGNEDLKKINDHIKHNTIQSFEQNCVVKDSNFLDPYINKLEDQTDTILIEFRKNFKTKLQDLNRFYNSTVDEAIERCFVVFFSYITQTIFVVSNNSEQSLQSDEDSITFRKNLISDVQHKYENVSKHGIYDEIKEYVNERTAYAADLLLIDKLIVSFLLFSDYSIF